MNLIRKSNSKAWDNQFFNQEPFCLSLLQSLRFFLKPQVSLLKQSWVASAHPLSVDLVQQA
jgi:hypothetical protein